MLISPEDLASRLEEEGTAALKFFQQLSPDQRMCVVYPGENGTQPWHVKDVLAHFVAAEQGFQQLITRVIVSGEGTSPDFDVDLYNRASIEKLRVLEWDVLLVKFAMTRERTVELARGMSSEQLARRGRHPSGSEMSVADMLRIAYNHNKLHLRDIRRVLGTGEIW
jgi:hypothetical protein